MLILEAVRGLDDDFVFPSVSRGKDGKARPQSVMVFKSLFKRMGREGFTTHGFRSTFRDWCGESAKADREVAEAALSHAVGNDVERAYARSDLFERRRTLMDAWAAFATGNSGTVTRLVRA
jgi:integrase